MTEPKEQLNQLQQQIVELEKKISRLLQDNRRLNQRIFAYETTLEDVHVGYWDWYFKEEYEYLSPPFKKMFGYQENELSNEPGTWKKLVHPEDLPTVLELIDAHIASRGETPFKTEIRFIHRDGSIVLIYCQGRVVDWDAEGNPVRMVGSNVDVTDLVAADVAYRSMFDSAAIGIAQVDVEGRTIRCNKAMERILGYTREELAVKPFRDFTHPDDAEEVVKIHKDIIAGKLNNLQAQKRYRHKNGHYIWAKLTVSAIRRPDGVLQYVLAHVDDITPQKIAEQQAEQRGLELERSNHELEHFAYMAAHDLQEPLRSISGFSQLLAKKLANAADPKIDQYLDYILAGTGRMKELLDGLLTYSRVGKNELVREKVDLQNIVAVVKSDLAEAIIESNAKILYHGEKLIDGNSTYLTQIMQNLIGNAIKFRGTKTPQVEINTESQKDNWLVSVSDNGVGIEENFRDRVFEVFQRLHQASEYPGTGIGLAMVKKLVQIHGGKIWIEDTPGGGTTFKMLLPKDGSE